MTDNKIVGETVQRRHAEFQKTAQELLPELADYWASPSPEKRAAAVLSLLSALSTAYGTGIGDGALAAWNGRRDYDDRVQEQKQKDQLGWTEDRADYVARLAREKRERDQ